MNNIAGGFERRSDKELKYFLYIAKGSCREVRSILILEEELQKMKKEEVQKLKEITIEISKLFSGFIKTLN